MTERPEERDSLAEIEDRLARRYQVPMQIDGAPGYYPDLPQALADLRTLINEVKERDEALRKIRDRDLEWDDEEGMVAVAEGVIGSKDRPE
jgi:hypothetical protein